MKRAIITTRDLLGFKELEDQTGIAGSTIRRYGARFKAYLPYRVIDRQMRFKPEVVETFKRIHALYAEGRRSDEVAAILAEEFPQTHDVPTPSTAIATPDPAETMVEIARAVNRVSEALAAQAEVKPIVEKLVLAVEALAWTQAETLELLREQQAQIAKAQPAPKNEPEKGGVFRALVKFLGGERRGE